MDPISAKKQVFANKHTLYISTGNVVDLNALRRRRNLPSPEEFQLCVSEIVDEWIGSLSDDVPADETLHVRGGAGTGAKVDPHFAEHHPVDAPVVADRKSLKFSVKLFPATKTRRGEIREFVEKLLKELGVSYVESLIVSFPDVDDDDDADPLISVADDVDVRTNDFRSPAPRWTSAEVNAKGVEDVMASWRELEDLVDEGKLLSIGVADLSKQQLERLVSAAKTKPNANQVNLTTCCVIPEDLKALAKDHDIQLLTHNDPRRLVDDAGLDRLLLSCVARSWTVAEAGATGWRGVSVARYSSMLKGRGIIKSKGYLVKAIKEV